MTHEQWDKLTPEEQSIKVAELRGLKCSCSPSSVYISGKYYDSIGYDDCDLHDPDSHPDFLHDLNAMHEAMKRIPCTQWTEFQNHLMKITQAVPSAWDFINATAADRAEAFVLTMTGG